MLRHFVPLLVVTLALLGGARSQTQPPTPATAGAISKAERDRALGILDGVSKGIQELYYDPKMNGVDWNAVLSRARTKIGESNSLNEALTQIAIAVDTLHDSHTRFYPPARPYRLDFGFEHQMIWSLCFVTRVRPGSDAEARGLKPGTQILKINGVAPTRQNLPSMEYLDNVLDPRPEMQLEVQYPSGEQQKLEIKAKVIPSSDIAYRSGAGVRYDVMRKSESTRHRMRPQLAHFGDVAILRLPWFVYRPTRSYDQASTDEFYYDLPGKIHNSKGLIIDLRGNHGGYVDALEYFVGTFINRDVKVCDKVMRKKISPEIVKKKEHLYFPGKLIVLVDSESASAAEIFARVVQLEHRGTIMGDRTSGRVMEATGYYFASSGVDYGAEVTIANLIMADGKSLEHIGVMPDEIVLPQPSDLEKGRDPVLSRAAQELGFTISPEDAGRLFPYEWPQD
jgi:carboxyl-terminal processing protease